MCDGEYPRVKRVDGRYGCLGCYCYRSFTHWNGQIFYYCASEETRGVDSGAFQDHISFVYPIVKSPIIKIPTCSLPERWKQVSNVEDV